MPHRLQTLDDAVDTRATLTRAAAGTARDLRRHALRYAEALCALHTIDPDDAALQEEAKLTVLALETMLETKARAHAYMVNALALVQRLPQPVYKKPEF